MNLAIEKVSFIVRKRHDSVMMTIPLKTVSEPNVRQHWSSKASRAKGQRCFVGLALRPQLIGFGLPVRVLITRMSSGTLDDDNLRGALKAVRDGITDAPGLKDDSDPRVSWHYAQAKAKQTAFGIEVAITRRSDDGQ